MVKTYQDTNDQLHLSKYTVATDAEMKRKAIAEEAVKHIGAHYLRGGYGAIPGVGDGAKFRPGEVAWVNPQIDNPAEAMVAAACCTLDNERTVCSGRYLDGGGKEINSDTTELREYLNTLKHHKAAGTHQSKWPTFCGLTPRKGNWRAKPNVTKLVWGEPCTGIRHFDCIGFVTYVLWKVGIKSVYQRSIPHYIHDTTYCDTRATRLPGDIVTVGTHHIGILLDHDWVINCTSGPYCVQKQLFEPGKWSRRGRFEDSQL